MRESSKRISKDNTVLEVEKFVPGTGFTLISVFILFI